MRGFVDYRQNNSITLRLVAANLLTLLVGVLRDCRRIKTPELICDGGRDSPDAVIASPWHFGAKTRPGFRITE